MTKPPALRPGSRIALVSPSSPFAHEEFEKGCAELRRLGFEPVWHDSVFDKMGFTSGPPELRAAAFVRAWSDPSIAAVMAVRGGYGSVQVLPELEGWQPGHAPKLFIGYSDNTSILTWLTGTHGLTALHGPMLEGRLARGPEGYDEQSFMRIVMGEGAGLSLAPEGLTTIQPGEESGLLFGGTLSLLCASLGTPFAFNPPAGCVLFIEDVNERPFRLHRMLMQLQLAGILGRAKALVFGEMRGCDEEKAGVTARGIVEEFAAGFDGPVLFGFPSGHTTGPCVSLPLGSRVQVRADHRPAVTLEESPVA